MSKNNERKPFQSAKPYIYTSSNGHNYCFREGGTPPFRYQCVYKYWKNDDMDSNNLLLSLPSGYIIMELSGGNPHLLSESHTRHYPDCQWEKISDVVDSCDQTWYTIAMVAPNPRPKKEAAIRGWISDLEEIQKVVSCPECLNELKNQIKFQKNGIGMHD